MPFPNHLWIGPASECAPPHSADEAPRDPARPASKPRRSDTASAIGHARPGIGGHLPRAADDGRRGRHPGPARAERHPRTLLAPRPPGPRRYGAPVAGPPTPQPLGQIAIGRRSQPRGFVLGRFADAAPAPGGTPWFGRHPQTFPSRAERPPRTLLAPRLPGPRRYGAPVAGPPTPQPLGQIAIGRRSQPRRFVLGRFADAGPAPGGMPCVGRHPQTFTKPDIPA